MGLSVKQVVLYLNIYKSGQMYSYKFFYMWFNRGFQASVDCGYGNIFRRYDTTLWEKVKNLPLDVIFSLKL